MSDPASVLDERVKSVGLGFLATLRSDGSPRISGLELSVVAGIGICGGMMPGSVKATDLRRDGRYCIHIASIDREVTAGDVKFSGVARELSDDVERDAFARHVSEAIEAGAANFVAFEFPPAEIVVTQPAGDELKISRWTSEGGLQEYSRR